MLVVLVGCTVFLIFGFLFKGQCLDGRFNENAFQRLCYNDLQPLFGPRLHVPGPEGEELVFPYVHGSLENGELRNGAIEYPVLTGLFMYASALFADDGDAFLRVSALFLAPFALLVAYLLARLAGWKALLWALAPAVILYAFHNWDLLVIAAAVTGIWFWSRGRPLPAAVAFGVGAAFKMWPILFVGPLVLEAWHARRFKSGFASLAAGVGTVLAINLPFARINFDGWWATYEFHRNRGPNFDSIWWIGWSDWPADKVTMVSSLLTVVFFAGILAASWWLARKRGIYPFIQTCGALLAAFLLWNKVHSPQFTLWLLPFFVLLGAHVTWFFWWVAYAIADLAVYVGVFRWFHEWGQGVQHGPAWQLMRAGVWARAALLLILVGVFLAARRSPEPGEVTVAPATPPSETDGSSTP